MKKMITTAAALLLTLILVQTAFAQSDATKVCFKDRSLQTLAQGITSQNDGVRKSSIYLAGKYRITELVPFLCEQLQRESDPFTKRLILLTIHQTGETTALFNACHTAMKDTCHSVKHLSAALLMEIQNTTLASE